MVAKKIGKYEIQEIIGRGGMGVVYKAVQVSLNRTVAIKTLPSQAERNPNFIDRLKKEANILAKLQHPNIVYIFDILRHEDDDFLVMEYIPGKTIAQLLREQPQNRFAPEHAKTIIRDVASALSHAHRHSIIHRDVKPANIMITREGVVKVTDFGVARLTSGVQVTQTGLITGTPNYMSPEQIRGEKDLDGRSDIYCLGIVFYKLLTGRAPFEGYSEYDVLIKQVKEDPVPPSEAANDPALIDCEEIVLRCMAKDRADRYQTADQLIQDLDSMSADKQRPFVLTDLNRIEDEETRAVAPPHKPNRIRRYAIGLALILVATAGLATYFFWPKATVEIAEEKSVKPTLPETVTEQKTAVPTAPGKPEQKTTVPTARGKPEEKSVKPSVAEKLKDELTAARPVFKKPPGKETPEKPAPEKLAIQKPVKTPAPEVSRSVPSEKLNSLPILSPHEVAKRHFNLRTRFDSRMTDSSQDVDRIHAFLKEDGLVRITESTDYDLYFVMDKNENGVEVRFLSKIQAQSKGGAAIVSLPFENTPSMISKMEAIIKREYCFKILRSLENKNKDRSDFQLTLAIRGGRKDQLRVGQKIDICLTANKISYGMLLGVDLEGIYLIPPQSGKITTKMDTTGKTCVKDLEVAAATGTEMLFAIGAPDETMLSELLTSADNNALILEWSYNDPERSNAVNFCERLYGKLTRESARNWSAGTQLISTRQ